MPWKVQPVSDIRFALCHAVRSANLSVVQAAREFAVSRKTARKWLKVFDATPHPSSRDLAHRSRKPRRSPDRTCDAVEAAALHLRDRHNWGPRKIQFHLAANHQTTPFDPHSGHRPDAQRTHRAASPAKAAGTMLWTTPAQSTLATRLQRTRRSRPQKTHASEHPRRSLPISPGFQTLLQRHHEQRLGRALGRLCQRRTPRSRSSATTPLPPGEHCGPRASAGLNHAWHAWTSTSLTAGPITHRLREKSNACTAPASANCSTSTPDATAPSTLNRTANNGAIPTTPCALTRPSETCHPPHDGGPAPHPDVLPEPHYPKGSTLRTVCDAGKVSVRSYRILCERGIAGEKVRVEERDHDIAVF